MTRYACGSCPYQSDDLGEAEQHSHQTGHVCVGKDGTAPAEDKFGKVKAVGKKVGGGVLIAAAGVLAWKHKDLRGKYAGAVAMAAGLAVQVAAAATENAALKSENEYLKSPSGAGKNLKRHHHI
ncbi:hypothetical protein [Kitasatospora cineracea]|uniref:C2H2-type domain-containing protein n=1 Tax=Kitasatospora cineracea TaxID=88074 RepID=A0A3N4RR83_9ACTN|nr:hypothetical protein [Kitasatospora cineracea]RPE26584.1 hypothetical protein EDD38_7645 [Kitasatospora cineracea]